MMPEIKLWKVFTSLGVPGLALGVFYMLFRQFQWDIQPVWAGPLAVLFMLLTAGLIFYTLTLYAPVNRGSSSEETLSQNDLTKAQKDYLFKELGQKQQLIDRLLKELDAKTVKQPQTLPIETVEQKTESDQSPAIYKMGAGDINITYNVAIEDRDAEIKRWVKKYKELNEQFERRSAENPLVAQAKAKLDVGDLEGAEKLLRQSFEQHLQNIEKEKKSAASDAFELAGIKELQIDYKSARLYYKKAVELDSKNTLFLNSYGLILNELGEYKKAIEYFTQALAIDKKTYGDQHPNVAIYLNNLGSAWRSLGEYK
ncbi:MAG: tetratricopeptide repeat protein, partial [Desulfobacteraceae bacterium]|nr:tetratricopeptide repeat protein [Desulfobacteraceae bacterium]